MRKERTEFLGTDCGGLELDYDADGNLATVCSNGIVVTACWYDSYGRRIANAANAYAPRFGFSSRERAASGLVYYGFRYASPELCRWTTPDPIRESGGLNLYAFCGNDPVCCVDDSGESPQIIFAAAAVIGIYYLFKHILNSLVNAYTTSEDIELAKEKYCVSYETGQYEDMVEAYKQIINNVGKLAGMAAEDFPGVSFALRSGGGIIKPQAHWNEPVLEQSLTGRFKYKKINGYFRKDGTYVPPYYRRLPRKKSSDGIPREPEIPAPNNALYPRRKEE